MKDWQDKPMSPWDIYMSLYESSLSFLDRFKHNIDDIVEDQIKYHGINSVNVFLSYTLPLVLRYILPAYTPLGVIAAVKFAVTTSILFAAWRGLSFVGDFAGDLVEDIFVKDDKADFLDPGYWYNLGIKSWNDFSIISDPLEDALKYFLGRAALDSVKIEFSAASAFAIHGALETYFQINYYSDNFASWLEGAANDMVSTEENTTLPSGCVESSQHSQELHFNATPSC